ncbi:hypothetical protein [Paludifilum halophilum]|uniref:hypothetical protein n=1 Tax=Paludifilum halophilum TaxID=1642702 RepID=UPI00113FF7EC|nr:hypothetical protein [Paludifilum halophilum]
MKFPLHKAVMVFIVTLVAVTLHGQEAQANDGKHEATYRFLYGEALSKDLKAYCESGVRTYRSEYDGYVLESSHACTGTEDDPPTFVLADRDIEEREVVRNDEYACAEYRVYPLPDTNEKVKVYYELYHRAYRETFDFVEFSPFQQ